MITDEMVEATARAIWLSRGGDAKLWDGWALSRAGLDREALQRIYEDARAALAAVAPLIAAAERETCAAIFDEMAAAADRLGQTPGLGGLTQLAYLEQAAAFRAAAIRARGTS